MPDTAMPDRTPLLAANWKMNKTLAETADFMAAFLDRLPDNETDVIVCPPFTALAAAAEAVAESRVEIAAQNFHQEPHGAFTGEISAPMLLELGVKAVVLGHSERRQFFGETDEALARKVPAALEAGLLPILCVGENEAQRDADETADVLTEPDRRRPGRGARGPARARWSSPTSRSGRSAPGKTATPEHGPGGRVP